MIDVLIAAGAVAYILGVLRRFDLVHTYLTYGSALVALPMLYMLGVSLDWAMVPYALCAGIIGLAAESLLNHVLTTPRLLRR